MASSCQSSAAWHVAAPLPPPPAVKSSFLEAMAWMERQPSGKEPREVQGVRKAALFLEEEGGREGGA